MKKKKTVKQQLIYGFILFGMIIITGSLQVIFSPFTFVRGAMLLSVIGCSMGVGAFIREFFIMKNNEKKLIE
ncbi:hypothetical protein ACIQD3_02000 [Peribacillus loiseleuriae]|uniref:hypothetical protein n=1 Tax=Peribacillus loiseleuriae TaxID=1679170 RepID=UPI00382E6FD8